MKISKDLVREMIKDALLEADEEDIIRALEEPESPDAMEIRQQSIAAMEQMMAGLEGIHGQLQEMGEMIRGVMPELNGEVANVVAGVEEFMMKLDNATEEMQSEDTE